MYLDAEQLGQSPKGRRTPMTTHGSLRKCLELRSILLALSMFVPALSSSQHCEFIIAVLDLYMARGIGLQELSLRNSS